MVMQSIKALSPTDLLSLYRKFGSFSAALSADRQALADILCGKALESVLRYQEYPGGHLAEADKIHDWCCNNTINLVPLGCDHYPPLLKEISRPPPLLFVKGDPAVLALPQIALVGSRNASATGINNAEQFSQMLAANGFVVTSGMALGIDGAAHRGAMEQGKTVAVVGTGLDICYPRRHSELQEKIVENGGAVISEFYPGTPPVARNFPRRNRIISGMSVGVLVVEAALKSGSLITARLAMEENREVFAIPSTLHNPLGKGCHQLIKQGATLVETAADIVEHLGSILSYLTPSDDSGCPSPLAADQQLLLDAMGFDTVDSDWLVNKTGLSVTVLNQQLLALELAGVIEKRGGYFIRVR